MNWRDEPIDADDEGQPIAKGEVSLRNDKNDYLAGVIWFVDEGPFYAYAMDANDTTQLRRIGPCATLDGAKQCCFDALEGRRR